MKNDQYRVSITVTGAKLSTILDVLTKEGSNLRVDPLNEGESVTMRTPRAPYSRGGSPMTVFIRDWIIGMPKDTLFVSDDVRKKLKEGGFNPTNYSPIMSGVTSETTLAVATGKKGQYKSTGKAK